MGPGLLAGWALLATTGLLTPGIGRSRFLVDGAAAAGRGFGHGAILSIPWALLNVLLGGAQQDDWVQAWWQPLVAIQPGIAEEAWGRVLLVPLLYVALRPWGRPRAALTTSVLVVGYWFAWLHTDGAAGDVVSTLLIGTLYVLPVSYLWLRQGLETAVGFHFGQDFLRFGAAYVLNRGLWLP